MTSSVVDRPRRTSSAADDQPMTKLAGAAAQRTRWSRPALGTLLLFTGLLYLWSLDRNGTGNDFYAAAVQAGTKSWKAFFFGSIDPSNYITVDKPPASLWVMELSGRIFGFNSWSMLVPQALEGVATVGILYAAVRRWYGDVSGLLAGAALALTPIAAVMFRFNNPDALLTLLIVAAGYATVRAVEKASPRWLVLAGVMIGFGFLTKMLQAVLIVPALGLTYLLAAPTSVVRRILHLLGGAIGIIVGAGWWVLVVALTPASSRPYVGGSTNNSVLQLAFGYNGLSRISSGGQGGGPGLGNGPGRGNGFGGAPGLSRLFDGSWAADISWLILAALLLLIAGLWLTRHAPRTDLNRAGLVLWGGSAVTTGLVFSLMSGIVHEYYSVALAPLLVAVPAAMAPMLWRRGASGRAVLAGALAVTVVWAYVLLSRDSGFHPWLRVTVLVLGLLSAAALLLVNVMTRQVAAGIVTASLVASLAAPAAYAVATDGRSVQGSIVNATGSASGPGGGGPGGGPGGQSSSLLTTALQTDASSYTWVAATGTSSSAASLELATGQPVMAIGGWNGLDDAISLARFKQLVAAGRIHYFIAGGMGGGAGMGGPGNGAGGPGGNGGALQSITSWVESTFTATTVGGQTVYDLTASRS